MNPESKSLVPLRANRESTGAIYFSGPHTIFTSSTQKGVSVKPVLVEGVLSSHGNTSQSGRCFSISSKKFDSCSCSSCGGGTLFLCTFSPLKFWSANQKFFSTSCSLGKYTRYESATWRCFYLVSYLLVEDTRDLLSLFSFVPKFLIQFFFAALTADGSMSTSQDSMFVMFRSLQSFCANRERMPLPQPYSRTRILVDYEPPTNGSSSSSLFVCMYFRHKRVVGCVPSPKAPRVLDKCSV